MSFSINILVPYILRRNKHTLYKVEAAFLGHSVLETF